MVWLSCYSQLKIVLTKYIHDSSFVDMKLPEAQIKASASEICKLSCDLVQPPSYIIEFLYMVCVLR